MQTEKLEYKFREVEARSRYEMGKPTCCSTLYETSARVKTGPFPRCESIAGSCSARGGFCDLVVLALLRAVLGEPSDDMYDHILTPKS